MKSESFFNIIEKITRNNRMKNILAVCLASVSLLAVHSALAQVPSGGQDKNIAILPPTGNGKLPNPLPSGTIGNPATPLSSEKMPVSGDHIDDQINKVIVDSDKRMEDVHVGNQDLTPPSISDSTLLSQIAAAEKIREMRIKGAEAQAAIDLWKVTYDGKREEEKPKSDKPESAQSSASSNLANNDLNKQHLEEQQALLKQQQEVEKARQAEIQNRRRAAAASIPPVISSIYGPANDPKAALLIPYVGEREVLKGDKILLVDGTNAVVKSITPDGVVLHRHGQDEELGFGTSVPTRASLVQLMNDDMGVNKSATSSTTDAPR